MLKLTRKPDESIQIGADIRVTLLKISGGRAQIGIQAPQEMAVMRSELLDGVQTTRKHDFGPISFIAYQLYKKENGEASWNSIPLEVKLLYRSRAESLVAQWRAKNST